MVAGGNCCAASSGETLKSEAGAAHGDGARSGGEVEADAEEGAAEEELESQREPLSPCCSISVQIPTISVIMLRMASAVLLSPAAAGAGSGSAKKLPV